MRKTKSEAKTVGIFANCSQCVANFAMRNFAMRKTTAQCEKPFGNAKIHLAMRKSIWQCEKPFGNAKNHLAMRKTIWQCENPFGNAKNHLGISQCEISQCENHIANSHCEMAPWFAKFRIAKWHHGLRNFTLQPQEGLKVESLETPEEKQEFSQTVRKQFATIWHCEMWFANFALRISHCENSVATKHYSFVSQKRQNRLRNFALRIGNMVCEISHCEMAPWFAKFRIAKWHHGLRNFTLRNGTMVCEISHCEFRNLANSLRKFLFCFFSSDFQYMLQNLHKTSKIKARKIA